MAKSAAPPSFSPVTSTLVANRLGVGAVVFFVMSAATPLTFIAGVVTTGYATTGLTGIPVAFVVVGAVLALFCVGYVAMARRVANAGAFYSYIAQGLGRPSGVGAAWVALPAYNALQIGLYGAIGAATTPLLEQWLSISPPWWLIAVAAWALTGTLGLLRVDVNGRVLAVLLLAEVVVIVVYSAANLAHPVGGHLPMEPLSPGNLVGPGVGAVLILATLGFVGFESAVVFAEESKDPRRTIPTASYLAVGLITALYAFAAWAMTVPVGAAGIQKAATDRGPELIFAQAQAHLGVTAATLGRVLFVTSLIAAMISFHNTTARYMFALGREKVLPAALGRTSRRTLAPRTASLVQSALGITVIVVYAVAGLDPLVQLFFWLGTVGALGVLFLLLATSVAVIVYFGHNPGNEPAWQRVVAPALAAIALAVVVVLAVKNLAILLGVPPGHLLSTLVPAAYGIAALAGAAWGLTLRSTRPEVYAAIGLGAKAAIGPLTTAVPQQPTSADTVTARHKARR